MHPVASAARVSRPRRQGRPESLAQALVETALVAPVVIVLLLGAAQAGAILFAQVGIDSAAREGAIVAAANPDTTLSWAGSQSTYTCAPNDTNEICTAAQSTASWLAASQMTITITAPASLSRTPRSDAELVSSSSCTGNTATVLGGVTLGGNPPGSASITVAASGGGKNESTGVLSGSYQLCVAGDATQAISASTADGCWAVSQSLYTAKHSTTTLNINLIYQAQCAATPTPSPTAGPSPTPGPPPPTATPGPTPAPAGSCSAQAVSSSQYVSVKVAYSVPVFIPLVGSVFGAGSSTVSETMTLRIEPCAITQGS